MYSLVQAEQSTEPQFAGTAKQKNLAQRLQRVFQMQGRFFSEQAPIRISLASLAEFMHSQEPEGKDWPAAIDAALSGIGNNSTELTFDSLTVTANSRATMMFRAVNGVVGSASRVFFNTAPALSNGLLVNASGLTG